MFRTYRTTAKSDLNDAYQLRYHVYCHERQLLTADDYPDGYEQDEYDPHSVHLLARHVETNALAGYCRLILHNSHGFPCEDHFTLTQYTPCPEKTFEISRLIIAPNFRTAWRDIIVGLTREIYIYGLQQEMQFVYAAMETPLIHMINRLGYLFTEIGEETWYYNTPNYPVGMDFRDFVNRILNAQEHEWYYDYLRSTTPRRVWQHISTQSGQVPRRRTFRQVAVLSRYAKRSSR